MMWRTIAGLAAVLALALWSFATMVERHVTQVVAAYAHDKARHLVEMLQAETVALSSLQANTLSLDALSEFSALASATDVHAITLFDAAETRLLTINSAVGTAQMFAPASASADAAVAVSPGPAPDTLGTATDLLSTQIVLNPSDRFLQHTQTDQAHSPASIAGMTVFDPALLGDLQPGNSGNAVSVKTVPTSDGATTWMVYIAKPVLGAAGATIGYAGFVLDVRDLVALYTENIYRFAIMLLGATILLVGLPALGYVLQRRMAERMQRDVSFLSRFDPLTKLLNRSSFMAEAKAKLNAGTISHICFIDADRFKLINDTYGHAVGDAFLKSLAKVFRQAFPDPSLIARFGGDEFVIAVAKADEDKVAARATAMVLAASREVEIDGLTLSGSISVGLAKVEPGEDLDKVLQHADTALYFAKKAGRDNVAQYQHHMGDKMRRRRAVEARLRDCAENDEFEIEYQPLIDAKSKALVGYEALLRMRSAEGHPIPPAEFIPLAEEMGLIEEIGTWVLHHATCDIAMLDNPVSLSVNISPEQFRSGNLIGHVKSALGMSGLPAKRLELEITESLLIDDQSGTEFQIDTLKELGVTLAMDDFGTGFSSLGYLWKYGFDRLKIDRSFVQAMDQDSARSRDLIESIILLAERLGIDITAEGIETEDQARVLSGLGCDVLQGYYFGRPGPLQQDIAVEKTGA